MTTAATVPGPAWLGADDVRRRVPMAEAIDELGAVLRAGFDPEDDGQRSRLHTSHGELLQMPSANEAYCGTKLATVCPGNEGTDLPVIQGVYVLFDGPSMQPLAVLDGAALTTLRTPAVSGLAVRHLAAPGARRLALLGTGVQARAHVDAVAAAIELEHVDVIGRTPANVERLVEQIRVLGFSAAAAGTDAIADADVVACCTSASEPLFDGSLVSAHAVVVAVGAHHPTARELDTSLVQRSTPVVESLSSARREAGDVMVPISEGALDLADLVMLRDVVTGEVTPPVDAPRVFKSTGMPWEDLAVAAAVTTRTPTPLPNAT